jgi:HK97 gp10 family phage protein
MMNVTVKIKGLDQLKTALTQIPLEMQRGPVRTAVKKAAEVVKKQAYQNVKNHRKTGLLESKMAVAISVPRIPGRFSYDVGVARGEPKRYVDNAKNRRLKRVGKKYRPQGAWFYWRFLEFGSSHQPKTPFLVPAFEAKKFEAVDIMKSHMGAAIERLVRRFRIRS